MMSPPLVGVSAKASFAGTRAEVASKAARPILLKNLFMSSLLCWFCWLLAADARVDEWRDEVGEQVAEHDGQRRNQGDAHDDRHVDLLDGLPGELADAGPAIYGLDHHHAAHELADVDADHGDNRQKRVGQRVAEHDAAAAETLGVGRAHI